MLVPTVWAWFLYAHSVDGGVREYGPYATEASCRSVENLRSTTGEKKDGGVIFRYDSNCVMVEIPVITPMVRK